MSWRAAATIGAMPASRSKEEEPGSARRWTTPMMGFTTPKMPSMTLPAVRFTRRTVPGATDAWQATAMAGEDILGATVRRLAGADDADESPPT